MRACCLLLLLFSASAGQAAPPLPLAPVEKWNLDYGATRCTAARTFNRPDKPTIFGIVPSISGQSFDLLVSAPGAGPSYAQESVGSVDFGRGPIRTSLLYYRAKEKGFVNYRMTLSKAQMEQARPATAASVSTGVGESFLFPLTDMPALLDGLENCTADLQNYWNMGAVGSTTPNSAVAAGGRSSKGDLRAIFTADDYPAEALSRNQDGTAQFTLLVDEAGKVAECYLAVPSGVAALDAMGCQVILQRAKFVPAEDSKGKPTRSVVTTPPVSWRIAN